MTTKTRVVKQCEFRGLFERIYCKVVAEEGSIIVVREIGDTRWVASSRTDEKTNDNKIE